MGSTNYTDKFSFRDKDEQARRARLSLQCCRALNDEGLYLNMTATGFTKDEFWAWKGNQGQFDAIQSIFEQRGITLHYHHVGRANAGQDGFPE